MGRQLRARLRFQKLAQLVVAQAVADAGRTCLHCRRATACLLCPFTLAACGCTLVRLFRYTTACVELAHQTCCACCCRYYGGNEFIDQCEELCESRALELFGLDAAEWGVNVQVRTANPVAAVTLSCDILPLTQP